MEQDIQSGVQRRLKQRRNDVYGSRKRAVPHPHISNRSYHHEIEGFFEDFVYW